MILDPQEWRGCESGPSVSLVFLCDLRQVTASLIGWRDWWSCRSVKPVEEKASPAREDKCHLGPVSRGSDIPSLTSYNAASVSNHWTCQLLAICWVPREHPGSLRGWFRLSVRLDSVLGSLRSPGKRLVCRAPAHNEAGALVTYCPKRPTRHSWRPGDIQNILQLVW